MNGQTFVPTHPNLGKKKWTQVSEARSQSEDVSHAEGDDNDTAGNDAAQERLDEEEEESGNTWGHAARRLTFQECG